MLDHPISDDCWKVLDFLRWRGWQAPAGDLCHGYGGLNYRGRISDLRGKHGLNILAEPGGGKPPPAASLSRYAATSPVAVPRHRVGVACVYKVPAEFRPLAEHLWRFKSRAGYFPAVRQTALSLSVSPSDRSDPSDPSDEPRSVPVGSAAGPSPERSIA